MTEVIDDISSAVRSHRKIHVVFLFVFLLICANAHAQVGSIKSASSSRGSGRSDGGRSGGSGFGSYFLINMMTNGLIDWQRATLHKRGHIPGIVSLEVYGQATLQPSRYYVFNPRARGNWGIFLTDFRMNYMMEETGSGIEDLRTDDWQVIGLNFINERNIKARISSGFMHEAFGEGNMFSESVVGVQAGSASQRITGQFEFRWVRDFYAGTNPRREISASFQKQIMEFRVVHLYATAGFVYQRYYSEINVWGFQAGIAMKLFGGPPKTDDFTQP